MVEQTVGGVPSAAVDVEPQPWRSRPFRMRLRLLTTAEGGRKAGLVLGYHASWRGVHPQETAINIHDAPIVQLEPTIVEPGTEAVAVILPLHPEYWDHVVPGSVLNMVEGLRLVGRATVLEGN